MTKNQTIELLKQQLPGFYNVEQVISIIEGIEEDTQTSVGFITYNKDQFEELKDELYTEIERELSGRSSDDLVDLSSACFELNGNEIYLESVDVNFSDIAEIATNTVADILENLLIKK